MPQSSEDRPQPQVRSHISRQRRTGVSSSPAKTFGISFAVVPRAMIEKASYLRPWLPVGYISIYIGSSAMRLHEHKSTNLLSDLSGQRSVWSRLANGRKHAADARAARASFVRQGLPDVPAAKQSPSTPRVVANAGRFGASGEHRQVDRDEIMSETTGFRRRLPKCSMPPRTEKRQDSLELRGSNARH